MVTPLGRHREGWLDRNLTPLRYGKADDAATRARWSTLAPSAFRIGNAPLITESRTSLGSPLKYRAGFAYVGGILADGEMLRLCRLNPTHRRTNDRAQ